MILHTHQDDVAVRVLAWVPRYGTRSSAGMSIDHESQQMSTFGGITIAYCDWSIALDKLLQLLHLHYHCTQLNTIS